MLLERQGRTQDSITYTNEVKPTFLGYSFTALFGLPAIMFVILGFYFGPVYGDWWVLFFFIPFAAILGFFAYMGLPIQRRVIYRYELNDDGIYQEWENRKTGDITKKVIPFHQVKKILIGINPIHIRMKRPSMNGSIRYVRFEAILFIIHEEGILVESFWNKDDLRKWVNLLENKVNITYTTQDLSKALQYSGYTKIDFSEVEGSTVDLVTEHIGKEKSASPFPVWLPDGVQEVVDQKKDEMARTNTKKAEKRTRWILFSYAILSAAILLPGTPLDEDGYIELTDSIFIWYLGINLLIPTLLVFFRRYSKWYSPLLYTIIVAIGNSIGILLTSFFTNVPSMFGSIFLLSCFNIFLWILAFIGAKIIAFLLKIRT